MKKRDLILIGAVLIIGLVAFAIVQMISEEGAYVSVQIDGDVVATYSLSVDGEFALNGGTNILKIENGEAWMMEADCPARGSTRCTAQGKISKTTETITCQHYGISVIVYGGEDTDIELVS